MAARSKVWVCGRSLAGIAVLSPSVCRKCCASSGRGLCDGLITRPEEVLPIVVCLGVISKPQQLGGLKTQGLPGLGKRIFCNVKCHFRL